MRSRTYPVTLLMGFLALLLLRGASCVELKRDYKVPTAAALAASVRARGKRVTALRAETRMTHQTSEGKIKATVRLMAAAGGKLRCDAVSPFDTPLITLVSDGKNFGLVDAKENRHYHGPASPCNLARLLEVRLSADDILTILGGSTPVIDYTSASLAWDPRAGVEVLTLKGAAQTQTLRLDGHDQRWDLLLSEVRDAEGKVVLRIENEGFHKQGALRLPREIKISQPKIKTELEVTFKQQEINIALPEAAWELPSAGGLPSQRVDCAPAGQR